ncbi:MAG TPA: hypothetical protein VFG72_13795 [Marmoricola sp.]|nr:hypothetical protein [Marmoricola sp.]
MADTPLWRQPINGAERALGPHVEALVRSEEFAIAVGLAMRARKAVEHRIARSSSGVLHRLNLPAATDVTRILQEIGRLNREVSELKVQLSRQEKAAPEPGGPTKPATTRTRRAKSSGDDPRPR